MASGFTFELEPELSSWDQFLGPPGRGTEVVAFIFGGQPLIPVNQTSPPARLLELLRPVCSRDGTGRAVVMDV